MFSIPPCEPNLRRTEPHTEAGKTQTHESPLRDLRASDANRDSVWVAGHAETPAGYLWIVKGSTDGGLTWPISDQILGARGAFCTDIAVDDVGDVYAVGSIVDAAGQPSWVVRKYLRATDQWITIESLVTQCQKTALPNEVAVGPDGSVVVVGGLGPLVAYDRRGNPKKGSCRGSSAWTVRRSLDRGATWATLESYNPDNSMPVANGVAVDSRGTVYVAGRTSAGWELWKLAVGQSGFTPVDVYGPYSNARSVATVRRQDGLPDDVYVAGWIVEGGTTYWVVRKLPAGGAPVLSEKIPGQALAVAADVSGRLYATGFIRDADGVGHWVVRRLAP